MVKQIGVPGLKSACYQVIFRAPIGSRHLGTWKLHEISLDLDLVYLILDNFIFKVFFVICFVPNPNVCFSLRWRMFHLSGAFTGWTEAMRALREVKRIFTLQSLPLILAPWKHCDWWLVWGDPCTFCQDSTRANIYMILLYYIVCYLIHTLISCYIFLFLVCDVSYMLQLHSAIDVNGLYCMIYELCNFMPLINKDRAAGMWLT